MINSSAKLGKFELSEKIINNFKFNDEINIFANFEDFDYLISKNQ